MDGIGLIALVVSLVALVVAALAFAHDWFAFQNPVLRTHFYEPHGVIQEDAQSIAYGPRGWRVAFSLFGRGEAYQPKVTIDREAPSPIAIRWWVEQSADVLTSSSDDEVVVVVDEHVRHEGLWIVVSYDVPRRFWKGTTQIHMRVAVPPNGSGARGRTDFFARGRWREQKLRQLSRPPLSYEIRPTKPPSRDED